MNTHSTNQGSSDDVVSLPVPKKYLSPMIQALAEMMNADGQDHSPQVPTPAPAVPWPTPDGTQATIKIEWDLDKLKSLRQRLNNAAAQTLLDMAAEKPNERIYVEDVAQKLGCSHGQVGAGLGVLTKCINKMLSLKNVRYNWPAPFNWDAEQQRAYYIMDEAVATAWKTSGEEEIPSQRDVMRGLVARFGLNEDTIIREYAAAERRGETRRHSNECGITPEAYARTLLNDALRKGWLGGIAPQDSGKSE